VQGTLDQPVEEAKAAARRAADEQGYTPAKGQGGPYELVFKKGASWGSLLTMELRASSPSETHVTVSIEENWAITDWGRSRRAARRLLDAMGAKH
jgi:hypothetical protein